MFHLYFSVVCIVKLYCTSYYFWNLFNSSLSTSSYSYLFTSFSNPTFYFLYSFILSFVPLCVTYQFTATFLLFQLLYIAIDMAMIKWSLLSKEEGTVTVVRNPLYGCTDLIRRTHNNIHGDSQSRQNDHPDHLRAGKRRIKDCTSLLDFNNQRDPNKTASYSPDSYTTAGTVLALSSTEPASPRLSSLPSILSSPEWFESVDSLLQWLVSSATAQQRRTVISIYHKITTLEYILTWMERVLQAATACAER